MWAVRLGIGERRRWSGLSFLIRIIRGCCVILGREIVRGLSSILRRRLLVFRSSLALILSLLYSDVLTLSESLPHVLHVLR